MKLLDFINANENWEEVLTNAPFNLTVKRSGDYILLKYNQIASDFNEPMVCEARGCIIAWDGYEYQYVCRPYNKFFNFGESNAAHINTNGWFKCVEKIDGSLIKVWYYADRWHISTNGTIDAYKAVVNDALDVTFGDLVKEAMDKWDVSAFEGMNKRRDLTYLFELVSPKSRVTVEYPETKLYFLSAINTKTGKEVFDIVPPCEMPPTYHFDTVEEIVEYAQSNPVNEGFVVTDFNDNRIKIKTPEFIRLFYLRNNGVHSKEQLVNVIKCHEQEEFLSYCPEYREVIARYMIKMGELTVKGKDIEPWVNVRGLMDQKSFALEVQRDIPYIFRPFAFSFRAGKCKDWDEFFDNLRSAKILEMMGED